MKDLSRSSQSQTKGTADKAEESILHIAVSGALCGGKHRGHWAMDPGASWCLVFSWDFWTSPQCPIDLDALSPGSHWVWMVPGGPLLRTARWPRFATCAPGLGWGPEYSRPCPSREQRLQLSSAGRYHEKSCGIQIWNYSWKQTWMTTKRLFYCLSRSVSAIVLQTGWPYDCCDWKTCDVWWGSIMSVS